MNQLFPFSRVRCIVLFLLSALFFISSCKKFDADHQEESLNREIEAKFFRLPSNAGNSLTRVADKMKSINNAAPYVVKFAKENGFPMWSEAITQIGTQANRGPNSSTNFIDNDTLIILPLVVENSGFVSGFVTAIVKEDVILRFHRGKDYNHYTFDRNIPVDSMNADKAVAQLLFLNNIVFGTEDFMVKDHRLFTNALADSAHGDRRLHITETTADRFLILSWTTCMNVFSASGCAGPGGCAGPTCNCTQDGPCRVCWPRRCSSVSFPFFDDEPWNGGGGGGGSPTGGEGGGGQGGGGSPYPCPELQGRGVPPIGCAPPQNPPPIIPMPPPPQNSPCDIANAKAAALTTLYNQAQIANMLQVPNMQGWQNLTIEKGFGVMRKFQVNSQFPQDISQWTWLDFLQGGVSVGTTSGLSITWSLPNLYKALAIVHTHPTGNKPGPSAADIFYLIGGPSVDPFLQSSYIAAADGSVYALAVTNPTLASSFSSLQASYLQGTEWNMSSAIGIAFTEATKYYENLYKGTPNRDNLIYEMAMGYVLTKFDTGISLNKRNSSGEFKPILVTAVTPDPNKPKKKIYTQLCNPSVVI